ncbi:MAG: hypothetical protein PWP23_3300 [Candidatus Sumerlaeota bacterium]|nr:hypothetical protein [Candidatus Sumerlaeota bacterium]
MPFSQCLSTLLGCDVTRALFCLLLTFLPLGLGAAVTDLEQRINGVFDAASLGDGARLGYVLVDAASGEALAAINADVPMKPASTTKLYTIATLLHHVEPTHRFATLLETDAELEADGTLAGDLIVRGGGDPSLGPRFGGDVDAVFREWATELKRYGITRIAGDVVGDDSYFADDRWGEGWYPAERAEYYMAEISALSFNDNCIDLTVAADGEPGGTAVLQTVAPETDFYRIESNVKIVEAGTSTGNPDLKRDEQQRTITAHGKLAAGESRTRWAAIDDPAHYAAHVLRETLIAEGIAVDGAARSAHRAPGHAQPNPPAAHVLYRHVSRPVSDQMVVVLANSQNLYAETMGRHAAIAAGKPSTFRGATEAIAEYVESEGLLHDGFALFDTSGLSSLNRVPPRMTADLLLRVNEWGLNGNLLKDSLDKAGVRGTMRGRLTDMAPRLRGKTGKLGDTDAFAGYLATSSGREYIVVVMIDLAEGDSQKTVDDILRATDAALAD